MSNEKRKKSVFSIGQNVEALQIKKKANLCTKQQKGIVLAMLLLII
jgi:hypothetical protein